MVEVKVKVKVKVDGLKKKARKPRKDKGTKRGKKGAKGTANPQFQRGSIDFRTIGTQQTSNPTLLAGLIASRAVVPQYLQPQQPQTSTELANYAPRDLPRNIPPPQYRPDVEQAQEETPEGLQTTQVRQAMGERIGRLRKEEASLFLKGKGMEAKNMKLGEELQQKQSELIAQDKDMDLKRKSFIVEQVYGATNKQAYSRIQSQILGMEYTGAEAEETMKEMGGQAQYREYLLTRAGLDPTLVDFKEVKAGTRGKARKDYFYNPQKADLQRAQEERPALRVLEEVEEVEERFDELDEAELLDEEPVLKVPKPYKAEFVPSEGYVQRINQELAAEEVPRQMSEIDKALAQQRKINKQNEMEELAKTATPLDGRLAQRLAGIKPKLPGRLLSKPKSPN